MKAALVRIAVDQAYGQWNGPVNACGDFVYVPIPEGPAVQFHPAHERGYREMLGALDQFGRTATGPHDRQAALPLALHDRAMHLDPDFAHLTYGDVGDRRGKVLRAMQGGDVIAFYSGLRPVHACPEPLIYALVGLYVVDEVVDAASVPVDRYHENAHTRKLHRGESDIVVRARRGVSGRLKRCIPIGEWRSRAYRVRHDLLDAWGGLSVKDGYVQRSAVPPRFTDPARFYAWFQRQGIALVERNN